MKKLKHLSSGNKKIPLREYHMALPEGERRASVINIANGCHVSDDTVYAWLRGAKIREIYKEKISQLTGLDIKKL